MKRLDEIISLIGNSKGVADIGTDHGYLPVKLALSGFEGFLFASDINPGPLSAAKTYAAAQGVSDKIFFSLSDGLSACDPEKIDCVVIAGMGGDLISDIISRAGWTYSEKCHLILQPMTKPEVLRSFLISNGFLIQEERLVRENARIFSIISTVFAGNEKTRKLTEAELITGEFALISKSELFPSFLNRELERTEKKLNGMRSSARFAGAEDAEYLKYMKIQEQMDHMRCQYASSENLSE